MNIAFCEEGKKGGVSERAEFLALKHASRILGHSSNPVCVFSISDGNLPDKIRTKSDPKFLPVYRSSPPCLDKECLTKVAFSAPKSKVRVVKNADYYVMY